MFEQIDTDRLTEEDEGCLGDQFRYSVWVYNYKKNKEPKQLYEDHAYIRPKTKNELTGTQGRDCTIKNLRIKKNKIKVTTRSQDNVEKQKDVELEFKI